MKLLVVVSLLSLLAEAVASGDRLNARQFSFDQFVGGAPKSAEKTVKSTPQLDPQAIRERVRWGPFTLSRANGTHQNGPLKLDPNSDIIFQQLGGTCHDCMVLWAQGHLELANGSEAGISSGVYNHHVLMIDFGRKMITAPSPHSTDASSASGEAGLMNMLKDLIPESMKGNMASFLDKFMPAMSIFVGQGSEGGANLFVAKDSGVKSGFHIQKNDKISLLAELVNYNQVPTEIYVALEYEYLPGRPEGFLDVGQFGIATQSIGTNLADIGFTPPKNRSQTYTSPEFPVIQNGYLLNVVPHLHDGGIDVKLFVNKILVCTSQAVYGESKTSQAEVGAGKWETITSYTACEKPIQVKIGDTLQMSSEYDLTKHRLRPQSANTMLEAEGMAIATYMFATSRSG